MRLLLSLYSEEPYSRLEVSAVDERHSVVCVDTITSSATSSFTSSHCIHRHTMSTYHQHHHQQQHYQYYHPCIVHKNFTRPWA